MKKSIIILAGVLALTFVSCKENAKQKVNEENVAEAAERDEKNSDFPVMTFTETDFDFGDINEGDVVEHTFSFKNTGNAPLVIVNATGSCGCTVPEWPKEPIAPGESGELLVKFNSNGKPNAQNKQVTITANTEKGKEIIKIKAMVAPKAKPATETPAGN